MTAPKTCFYRLRKGYGPKKKIIWASKNVEKAHFWASKNGKNDFSQKTRVP